ncbi:MAG: hypothetical protein CO137_02565 [Candidatus Magasanikbacteria bacterium CG_4_9_14_3_um_filter_32_9]|uniref:YdbS-like PH domain-containing protein n=1 Tax=Candidatus Magasanikbacteria bacterium CG_4_9_14_3_um_filter_32_9 TaxID=1974644 RepID=A0A2M7Z6I4_9BACT|nr:MAG: hypothetical protein CO137_02565 [Candidatus Magasanikbacteria bacterium CG_4_9_14_3_um_filter_32_9]
MNTKKINLKQDERILLDLRRYMFTLFWYWAVALFFLMLAFFLMFHLFSYGIWGSIGFAFIIFVSAMSAARGLYLWRKNMCIITNHRIIDINRRGVFDKVISEVLYDQVEGVSGRVKGIVGTIFRYGDVTIQTAAGSVQIIVEKIKDPVFIQQKINEFRHNNLKGIDSDETNSIVDKLEDEELKRIYLKSRQELKNRGFIDTQK